ncbi:hypothetical protein P7C70_g9109, partial [Phenoliferia sp. Uapishka_3]
MHQRLAGANSDLDYSSFAAEFPGREVGELKTLFEASQKLWRQALEPMDPEDLERLMSSGDAPSSKIEELAFDWSKIAKDYPGVTAMELRQYWKDEKKARRKLRKSSSLGGAMKDELEVEAEEVREGGCENRKNTAISTLKDDYAEAARTYNHKNITASHAPPATPIASTSRILPLATPLPSAPSPAITASGRVKNNITYTREVIAKIHAEAPDPLDHRKINSPAQISEWTNKWNEIADSINGGRSGVELARYWSKTSRNPKNKIKRQSDAGSTLENRDSSTQHPESRDPSAGPSDLKPVPPPAFVQVPPPTPGFNDDDNVEMEDASPLTPPSPALLVIPEFALLDEAMSALGRMLARYREQKEARNQGT